MALTREFTSEASTVRHSPWSLDLVPGPQWTSFEQFRKAGPTALEYMSTHSVGTLRCKSATFRILFDSDFQRLLGLATEVSRLKQGITIVMKAAKVVAKHNDAESIELLIQTASMLNQSNLLPERDGHGEFHISREESAEFSESAGDDIETMAIPRPSL